MTTPEQLFMAAADRHFDAQTRTYHDWESVGPVDTCTDCGLVVGRMKPVAGQYSLPYQDPELGSTGFAEYSDEPACPPPALEKCPNCDEPRIIGRKCQWGCDEIDDETESEVK